MQLEDWIKRLIEEDKLIDEVVENNTAILMRCWEKDYFTSALPWQQRGTAPALPISGFSNAEFQWLEDGEQAYAAVGSVNADEAALGETTFQTLDDFNPLKTIQSVGTTPVTMRVNDPAPLS